ncbi:hypothetical protein E0485_10915 [Paenibacillus albiflavus]|uniref:EfeO-type cupredoxin-like domain-containing protein n=1 Tax=Paenibacillus albiflavus TaxID=2545760 RepID=A0A4R4EC24_9BACL|nr:cupredoxin domain-containing protein [Paenibacillus albiflavus]TCZ77494.1 hypothetical protein E0485_10915 [Paenibacillus albiflavus]
MYKWLMSVLLIVAIVLGVGVLYSSISERSALAEQEKKEAGKSIKITASNFHFDKPEYKVKQGETWLLKFSNADGVHAMEIDGLDIKLDKANASKEVTFDKPGTYTLRCSLMCGQGHADMHSTFIVE